MGCDRIFSRCNAPFEPTRRVAIFLMERRPGRPKNPLSGHCHRAIEAKGIGENAWAIAEMRDLWHTIKQSRWSRLKVSVTFVLGMQTFTSRCLSSILLSRSRVSRQHMPNHHR